MLGDRFIHNAFLKVSNCPLLRIKNNKFLQAITDSISHWPENNNESGACPALLRTTIMNLVPARHCSELQ